MVKVFMDAKSGPDATRPRPALGETLFGDWRPASGDSNLHWSYK
jgi:hypothetical protein